MNKVIKNSHVLVIGSGSSLLEYNVKIKNFIEAEKVITFGCNNINHLFTPDYHFWSDQERYKEFGGNMNEKSIPVFSSEFTKELISKHCKKKYLTFIFKNKKPKKENEKIRIKYINGIMYGRFRTVGAIAIFYAYINKSSRISVVGMDGYTLYSEDQFIKNEKSQHCYNKGYTDLGGKKMEQKKEKYNYKTFYEFELAKDNQIYRCLKAMKQYGIEFKILTPTVYKDFYNSEILEKY